MRSSILSRGGFLVPAGLSALLAIAAPLSHAGDAPGAEGATAVLADSDGDGVDDSIDCRPTDASTWAVPSEARGLALFGGASTQFAWSGPLSPGGTVPLYDLIRSTTPSD